MTLTEKIWQELEQIIDPELGLPFPDLGLIYDVEVKEKDNGASIASVTYTLTTPACPIGPEIEDEIDDLLSRIEEIGHVETKLVFEPPWNPEMMSEDAKFALGF